MTTAQHLRSDKAHDVLRRTHANPLNRIFGPKRIAVVGASEREGSVGRALVVNLAPFQGSVFHVNPKHATVFGQPCFATVKELPEAPDLVLIATPAQTVPGIVRDCVEAGAGGAVILSAGFRESGPTGVDLERSVLAEAKRGKLRILGPNCLGLMVPHTGLNATFAGSVAHPGRIAFLSQSGALCSAILDWSHTENVGFSAFVSVGSMLDVGWGDLIEWLGDDPLTKSIIIYMESVGDARAFLSAAREVALTKPIIVIKVGKTDAAARAAATHTGALTGSDAVLDVALRRAGVLRVASIAELFDMAETLAKQPRPQGPRLAMVTNAGGPGALATDALVLSGGQLAPLSDAALHCLNEVLPAQWSHGNPIDVLGDAGPERFARAIEIAANDSNTDGTLVVMTPQAMSDPVGTASVLVSAAANRGKPLLASWMGGRDVAEGRSILNEAGIPTYDYPDTAGRVFGLMWQHKKNLDALYETPTCTSDGPHSAARRASASRIMQAAREQGRTVLSKIECNQILSAYDIPSVATEIAIDEEEAVVRARQMGSAVVLKLHSNTISHKSDVGGVKLDLRDEQEVRRAWKEIKAAVKECDFCGVTVEPMITIKDSFELILGSSTDPQFGPVLLFGGGGQLVETLQDHALGLPPLTTTLARRMMERTRIVSALKGVRGRAPVPLAALELLMVRFSQLVTEHPRISEIEINPLLAGANGFVALDVRAKLHGSDIKDEDLPRVVIRPYPVQYSSSFPLRDGSTAVIRPIRPDDEPLMVEFHQTLSEQSVYRRYFNVLRLDERVSHARLSRICFIDYSRDMALVVERSAGDRREILAVGRLTRLHGVNESEFAILVNDAWQHQGLGTELLRRLVAIGREEKVDCISADILPENHAMQALARKAGFRVAWDHASGECRAEMIL
jgi:acetyltransferase